MIAYLQEFCKFDSPVFVYIHFFNDVSYLVAGYTFAKSFHHFSNFRSRDMAIFI